MTDKKLPNADGESLATRMLGAEGEHDRQPPESHPKANSGSGALPPGQQDTAVYSPEETRRDSQGVTRDQPPGSPDSVSLLTVGQGDTADTGAAQSHGTQTFDVNAATGDFVVDSAIERMAVTPPKTNRSTVRSARERDLPMVIPESIGKYEIKSVLGRGGMGVVYLARQAGLDRDVALKMVLAGNHASQSQLDRFQAEARAVAQLQHPHIVQVFEVGEHDGLSYFSLEYVDGMSLDRRLEGKPLAPRDAAQLVEKICRAMQYAHDRNILHRDLKPANILLTSGGEPKVTDFGLAKQLEDEDSLGTKAGTILGTPSYMSPEQAQGLVHELTPGSDQYSLGALLYELLTGRPPFLGTKAFDTISQVVNKEPVPPCQLQEKLPVDIDTICLKALQKTADKRYPSCQAMADDLARFLRGEPIQARPIGNVERAWRWCRRNPSIAVPSALALTLLLATAFISSWSYLQISAQAAVIVDERDNARQQRDEANKQREEADKQRQLAIANEDKAKKEKDEADRLRILADEAKAQAEESQKQAERQAMLALRNIQFIITEVDNRLAQQPGATELRIGMLELLEKNWNDLDKELAGGIKGEAIPTLLTVRFKIAEGWVSLDQIAKADAQYATIEQMARERLVVKNRSDASRVNLAQILSKWSPLRQRVTGDPAIAEKMCEDADSLLREVITDPRPQPGSPSAHDVARVLQESLLKRANSNFKNGQLEKADRLYKEAEAVNQKVVDEIQANAASFQKLSEDQKVRTRSYFQQSVDLCKTGQANVLCRLGKADQAIPIYERVVQARRASAEAHPTDPNERDQLAIQLRNYGQQMQRVGRTEEALRLLGQAHDVSEQNINYDPKNANYRRLHGAILYYWGVANAESGHADNALALLERSRVIRQQLVDISPDQSNKVDIMLAEARLGNAAAAQKWIGDLTESKVKSPDMRLDLARALAQLSVRETDAGKRDELRSRAFAALEQSISDGLQDPFAIRSEVDLKPLSDDKRFAELGLRRAVLVNP